MTKFNLHHRGNDECIWLVSPKYCHRIYCQLSTLNKVCTSLTSELNKMSWLNKGTGQGIQLQLLKIPVSVNEVRMSWACQSLKFFLLKHTEAWADELKIL